RRAKQHSVPGDQGDLDRTAATWRTPGGRGTRASGRGTVAQTGQAQHEEEAGQEAAALGAAQ
ncbi:MAG TPA: hypothetical protein VFA45_07730, partial [Actinomycetes bacterium]|nr:hypothetical protein [Actinomycetes bacterium]